MQRSVFDFESLPAKLEKLETQMQAPGVWSDKNRVSKLGADIREIKDNIAKIEN